MRLILVRHGDTDNSERYWGHSDIELNATGLGQAERLRRRLASQGIDAIYTSTLKRAWLTADIIAAGRRLDVIKCAELDEVNFGLIEGLSFTEVCRLYPGVADLWLCWSHQLEFPEGESFIRFNNRVVKFLKRLERHAAEETVLIVGHGGPFRLLLCHLLALELEHWQKFRFALASISIIEVHPDGSILSQLSDVSHLE